jgi:hypothetical protein
MKKTLLFFLILNAQIYAQSTYFNLADSINHYANLIVGQDSNYIFLKDGFYFSNSYIEKRNKDLDVLLYDSLAQYPRSTFYTQIKDVSDGIILISSTNANCASFDYAETNILYQKFNNDMDLIIENEIIDADEDLISDFIVCKDNSSLIINTKFIQLGGDSFLQLIKLDQLGEPLWRYDTDTYNIFCSAVETQDSGFLVLNHINTENRFLKLDKNGNLINQSIISAYPNMKLQKLFPLTDSTFITYGTRQVNSNVELYQTVILKLNEDLTILDSLLIEFDSITYVDAINKTIDNEIIIALNSYPNFNSFRKHILLKLNHNLEQIWERDYSLLNYKFSYINYIENTPDNGYICLGKFENNVQFFDWLLKLDCMGCDSILCFYQDSICNLEDCIRYQNDYEFTSIINPNLNNPYELTLSSPNESNASLTWNFGNNVQFENYDSITYTYNQAGIYNVFLVFEKGICIDTIYKELAIGNVALENFEKKISISVFPNPNNGNFYFLNPEKNKLNVEIINAIGQTIVNKQIKDEKTEFNLTLNEGIYFIKVSYNSSNEIYKLKISK